MTTNDTINDRGSYHGRWTGFQVSSRDEIAGPAGGVLCSMQDDPLTYTWIRRAGPRFMMILIVALAGSVPIFKEFMASWSQLWQV